MKAFWGGVSNGCLSIAACLLFLAGVAMLAPATAHAQALEGSINGNVTDQGGSVVAGAAVNATDSRTNYSRDTTTNDSGDFTFTLMPPGTYTVKVTSAGFQTYSQTGVVLSAQAVMRVDAKLVVGAVSENVTVEASPMGELQTDQADVHAELTNNTLQNIPLPAGRNYELSFVTVAGISPPQSANSFGANPNRSLTFGANGLSGNYSNATRIDGTLTQNAVVPGESGYTPALDAVETVNITTNAPDAEVGGSGGASVNVSMKSGTNAIHGTLFEDHSDNHMKAFSWPANSALPKPKYISNDFGGTIGGPIKKDEVFYFASYDQNGYAGDTVLLMSVPTLAMRSGNLSAAPTPIYDPATGAANGTGRTAFPLSGTGSIIPANRIDKGIQALLNTGLWPLPNLGAPGQLTNNYRASGDASDIRHQLDTKFTYVPKQFHQKLTTNIRFGLLNFSWLVTQPFGKLGGPPFTTIGNPTPFTGWGQEWNAAASGTYLVSSSVVVDANYGYSRLDARERPQDLGEQLGTTLLQIPGLQWNPALTGWELLRTGGMPSLVIDSGWSVLGNSNNTLPQDYDDDTKSIAGNISWTKGAHSIRGGVSINMIQLNEDQEQTVGPGAGSGGFQFGVGTTELNGGPKGQGNAYNSFASFLLGYFSSAGQSDEYVHSYTLRTNMFGVYVRDQWQATKKLTATYGVRWEDFPFPGQKGKGLAYYNFNNNTVTNCGVAGEPFACGGLGDYRGKDRFEPRVGLAYRLGNSTVLRAGYGIAADPTNIAYPSRESFPNIGGPLLSSPNSFSFAGTLRTGLPILPFPNLTAAVIPIPTATPIATNLANTLVRGYLQTWNAIGETRLAGWVLSAGYIGSRAVDPIVSINENWAAIGTGTAGQQLNGGNPATPFGRTSTTTAQGTHGTTQYDSMQAHATRHLSSGSQFTAAYTYSVCNGYGTLVAIPQYNYLNHGPCPTDITHNVEISSILVSPFGANRRWMQEGVGAKVLGDWQFSVVFSGYTGVPFTATAPSTTLNAPGSTQFPNCSSPQKLGGVLQWYNTAAFTAPAAGNFGTCGYDTLRQPGILNSDIGLARIFKVKEKFQLKFNANMYNVSNTPHHTIPSANFVLGSSGFMQATSIANTGRDGIDERTVIAGLHLSW